MSVIKTRRSIRKYVKGANVTKEQLNALLEAAMHAPSACNTRPWEFLVVTNREKLNEIAQKHPFAKMLTDASAAIIVCGLPNIQSGVADGFFPQDCAAATQNILIAATENGLGTCWCGVFPKENLVAEIRGIFGLADNIVPFNVIAIGKADESPTARGFFEQEKVKFVE